VVREFVHGSRGLVTSAKQGSATTALTYDGVGRQTSETALFPTAVKYGLGGVPLSVSHGSRSASFDYTTDGRVQTLWLDDQEVFSVEYSGAGPAQFLNYGNGATWQRVFDARARITDEGDANVQLAYRYGEDGRTRLVQTEPQVPFGTDSTVLPPRTQMFGLDAIGRLSEELTLDATVPFPTSARLNNDSLDEYRASALQDVETQYDRAGNITIQTGLGSDWSPEANHTNMYVRDRDGAWMDYDADGRLVGDSEREYRYDAFGDLVQTSGLADTCDYSYDAFGRRIAIECDYDSTEFAHFGRTVTSTRINGTERHYFHGDGAPGPTVSIAETGSNTVEYYAKSKDGSVQTVSNQEGHGRAHYRYGVYGETELIGGGTTNRFGFHGQIHDAATGMYHMGARYYSPNQGRFITRDPIGVLGGANLYKFALNRPNDFWDPSGLAPYANPYTTSEMCAAYPCGEAQAQVGADDFTHAYSAEVGREMVSGLSSGVVTSLWPMGGAAESITGMDTAEFLSGGEIYHEAPYYFTKGATDLLIGSGQMFGGGTMFFSGGALLVTTDGLAVAASVPLMAGGVAVAGQGVTTAQAGWGSIGQGFDRVFTKGDGGEAGLKWGNPTSRPTYGHTFSDHSARVKPEQLVDRARGLGHQVGQWTDDKAAADFISEVAKRGPGVHDVPLPPGMGRSFLQDGTELLTDMARVVVKAGGAVRTAFPFNSTLSN
jgi:RHS repeat-associated protein